MKQWLNKKLLAVASVVSGGLGKVKRGKSVTRLAGVVSGLGKVKRGKSGSASGASETTCGLESSCGSNV